MLTRLQLNGFKNLVETDIYFGSFTCIAGENGVGKSNLFDAIHFLSLLAEKPLLEAALAVRSEGRRGGDLRNIFHRTGQRIEPKMQLLAEMLIPSTGVDDLGQEAKATFTFLRYELELELTPEGLSIRREILKHITKGRAKSHLPFPHRPKWRDSVIEGRRTAPFISTESSDGQILIKLHQDGGRESLGGGRPRPHIASRLPRTVLSSATNAAESPTAVLARREMQSWRLLQLEPSALRAPDAFNSPPSMRPNGAHLPATLARLCGWKASSPGSHSSGIAGADQDHAESIYAEIANRLSELIDEVHSLRVEADDSRELLKLMLRHRNGSEYEARSLSDGTLRFLALAILESDPTARGVVCLEEPENGIHPERIPAMLQLLRDLATDPEEPIGTENPLRQVIINTHSPAVVAQVSEDDLLLVSPEIVLCDGTSYTRPTFRWLERTWRAKKSPGEPALAPGQFLSIVYPIEPFDTRAEKRSRRVIDRPEIQRLFPFASGSGKA